MPVEQSTKTRICARDRQRQVARIETQRIRSFRGEIAELRFGLQPISVVVKKGHRLRVAIAGHDKSTFIRIPAEGVPAIAVQRNSRARSAIDLPLVKR